MENIIMNTILKWLSKFRQINQAINLPGVTSYKKACKCYYSHYGEDIILANIFENQQTGFYVDIGAYHPVLFSNTKILYDKGWRGINIDANVDAITLFQQYRPDDINLNFAINKQEGEADYYKFLEIDEAGGGSGNSLSPEIKAAYEHQGLKPTIIRVMTKPVHSILEQNAKNKVIDFMNIDIEGYDLIALQSNDWELFRPRVIAVEIWMENIDYDFLHEDAICNFLYSHQYKPFSNVINTWFFYDKLNPIIAKNSNIKNK